MKSSRILLLLLLLVIAAGCSGGGSSGGRSGPTAKLLSITISPSNPTVEQGVSQLFTARGNYSDGTSSFLTSGMTWSSSNTGAAAIDSATGIATSIVSTTTTTITVSSGGISDSTALMVTPAVLFSLDVEPAISSIAVGSTEQFSAMGTSTNSILTPLTASVIWASSVPDVTIISNATATALASGTTLITARSGNITGSAYLTATGGSAAADNNVMPITVNGSLCAATSSTYINKPCVSVKVCNPGTTTCDTVTDILLDTGSYGLRIFQQALKNVTPASGSLAECVFFGDGSSEWGPVTTVDVYLGNEPAVRIPIQIVDS